MEKIQIIQILELHKEGKMDDKTATDLLLLLCNSSLKLPSLKERGLELDKQVNTKCEDYRIDKQGFRYGFLAAYNWLNREVKKQR